MWILCKVDVVRYLVTGFIFWPACCVFILRVSSNIVAGCVCTLRFRSLFSGTLPCFPQGQRAFDQTMEQKPKDVGTGNGRQRLACLAPTISNCFFLYSIYIFIKTFCNKCYCVHYSWVFNSLHTPVFLNRKKVLGPNFLCGADHDRGVALQDFPGKSWIKQ